MSTEMSILDPHIHLWHPRETPRKVSALVRTFGFSPGFVDWLAKRVFPTNALAFFRTPEHITRPYLPRDFELDCANHPVNGVVHVEASWKGRGPLAPVEETRWLDGLTASGAGRIEAIVAHADLGLGNEVDSILQAHRHASDRVRGVRDMLSWHESSSVLNLSTGPNRSQETRWRSGFEQLAQHDLSFEATCYDSQLDEVSELARAYPEQPIVLCHLGTPIGVGGPFGDLGQTLSERKSIRSRWQEALARLAENHNVFVKLSGLTMPVCGFGFERRSETPSVAEVSDAIQPLITFAIEAFGVERCMFASNFPIDKVSLPYSVLFDSFLNITGDLTLHQRQQLFRDNAARIYRIEQQRF